MTTTTTTTVVYVTHTGAATETKEINLESVRCKWIMRFARWEYFRCLGHQSQIPRRSTV